MTMGKAVELRSSERHLYTAR